MIEIKIPQEINKYEAKLVGPFTTRQTLCLIGMGLTCLVFYNVLKPLVPVDYLYALCLIIGVPFALCGWYKPYGMHFEKFFVAVLFNTIISSSKRFFKSENVINSIENKMTIKPVEELNKKKGKKQKDKKNTKNKKNTKKIQKKYKKQTML